MMRISRPAWRKGQELRRQAISKAKNERSDKTTEGRKRRNGTVSYTGVKLNGTIYPATNRNKLSKEERNVLEAYAKAAGVDIVMYESPKNSAGEYVGVNGFYYDGVVYLDVNAGRDRTHSQNAVLLTAAHELTHFIRENAPAEYENLQTFVVTNLLNTVDFDALVQSKIRLASSLSYEDAVEEVVADACEMVLKDSTLIERLAKTNQSLYEKIRDWLKQFAEDVRKAFEGQEARHAEAMVMAKHMDELVELWDKGLEMAGSTSGSQRRTADKSSATKKSIRESFYSDIDNWDGKSKRTFTVGRTSEVLKSLGAKDSLIQWHGGKIAAILSKHKNITRDIIKQVPQILENPIVVLASKQSDSRLVMFGSVKDADGKPVTAILELQPTNRGGIVKNINIVVSSYGKDNAKGFIESSGLVYIDPNKNRTESWLQSVRLQLPSDTTAFGSIGRISYQDGKVKIDSVPYLQYMQGRKRNTKFSQRDNYVELTEHDWTRAEEHFGTTRNYDVAGYLLPDGKMLDFSGRHWGDSSSTMRQVEHRDIQEVWEDDESRNLSGFDEETNVIANGAIRLMPESGGINLAVAPSPEQIKTLRGFINHYDGQVILDIDDISHKPIASHSYDRGTSSSRVIEDIGNYFRDGILPETVSETAKFRYSRRDSDGSLREGQNLTYDALVNKPDMPITVMSDEIPSNRKDIIAEAKRRAEAFGSLDDNNSVRVQVKDNGREVVLSTNGLKHGLDRRLSENGLVTLYAGEILHNAIEVNEFYPKQDGPSLSYALIGAANIVDANGVPNKTYIVRFIVNRHTDVLTSVDVLYAINAKKERPAALNAPRASTPGTDLTISIADLLDVVKKHFPDILPMDVLRHYGIETRPKGELGTRAKYSRRDSTTYLTPEQAKEQAKAYTRLKAENRELQRRLEYWRGQGAGGAAYLRLCEQQYRQRL